MVVGRAGPKVRVGRDILPYGHPPCSITGAVAWVIWRHARSGYPATETGPSAKPPDGANDPVGRAASRGMVAMDDLWPTARASRCGAYAGTMGWLDEGA